MVVSLADARGKLPMDKLLEMKLDGVTFDHLASVYEEYTGKIAVENLRPSWLIFSTGFRKSRAADRPRSARSTCCVAGVGLMLALPGDGAGRARRQADVARARSSTTSGASGSTAAIFTVHKFRIDAARTPRRRPGRCGRRRPATRA